MPTSFCLRHNRGSAVRIVKPVICKMVIFKLLKRHFPAKRRAPAYSRVLRQIRVCPDDSLGKVQVRFLEGETVRLERIAVKTDDKKGKSGKKENRVSQDMRIRRNYRKSIFSQREHFAVICDNNNYKNKAIQVLRSMNVTRYGKARS